METTVDLEPEAFEKAQALAVERGQSIGKVLGDALLGHHSDMRRPSTRVESDEEGWPVIHNSGPITSEQVKAWIEEDETWGITHGDLHHPFHKPILTTDEQGFPQVDIGRPLTLEEVRAAVEEE